MAAWHRARRDRPRPADASGPRCPAAGRTWCARHACCTCVRRVQPRSRRATRRARRGPRASRARRRRRRSRGRGRERGRRAGLARAPEHHAARTAHARRPTRLQLILLHPSRAPAATVITPTYCTAHSHIQTN